MEIYGIRQEVDEFIDFKRIQKNLVENERPWTFEQRNSWESERTLTIMEYRNPVRHLGKQSNLIVNQESIRETSIGRNHVSRPPLVELSQERIQEERFQEKEIKKLKEFQKIRR
jgi:hypothetical protein